MAIPSINFQTPYVEDQGGGGPLGAIGSALQVAAPFAAFIPGVGPLASLAIGAGANAIGGVMQGGGVGNAPGDAIAGALGVGINKMDPRFTREEDLVEEVEKESPFYSLYPGRKRTPSETRYEWIDGPTTFDSVDYQVPFLGRQVF